METANPESANVPLAERLRPQKIQDLMLEEKAIVGLQAMLDSGSPASMLLYGPPGVGKTSTARIFMKARGELGTLTVDASTHGGIDNVRELVDGFASTCAFDSGIKICFIDEADCLSKSAQAVLRGVIERHQEHCRFIFAANDLSKIDKAIQSRLLCIDFALSASAVSMLDRVQTRLSDRLSELGFESDPDRLHRIMTTHFPDLRKIINQIEFEFGAANPSSSERPRY